MKKTVLAIVSATALVGLSACAEGEPAEEATVAEGEEEVEVNLPQTPVVPATPAADAGEDAMESDEGAEAAAE
ncbi:hypothetical protein OZN62_06630 [Aurantiacibacter sp. MUD11]|uniref:hypothetical protein n=1 Tax=Aurantiacibacter sp. MUD11 TaxID=3003265 RepID=UPI0022AA5F2F|nr:hypothetical protein [Aurantiacibacter sp. MUD11]WAT19237.1 hypothetical protein OZN62_06630 [Aurantiacibacter sp. MUD11]